MVKGNNSKRERALLYSEAGAEKVYSSDLTCSDKPLNIRDRTKVLF
jgi:2-methylisocitrate lyase-like PEP mutase family enzyme